MKYFIEMLRVLGKFKEININICVCCVWAVDEANLPGNYFDGVTKPCTGRVYNNKYMRHVLAKLFHH